MILELSKFSQWSTVENRQKFGKFRFLCDHVYCKKPPKFQSCDTLCHLVNVHVSLVFRVTVNKTLSKFVSYAQQNDLQSKSLEIKLVIFRHCNVFKILKQNCWLCQQNQKRFVFVLSSSWLIRLENFL